MFNHIETKSVVIITFINQTLIIFQICLLNMQKKFMANVELQTVFQSLHAGDDQQAAQVRHMRDDQKCYHEVNKMNYKIMLMKLSFQIENYENKTTLTCSLQKDCSLSLISLMSIRVDDRIKRE